MIAIRRCALADRLNIVSFERDIRPHFRDNPDIDTLQSYGIDLSSYEDVKARVSKIYKTLADGSVPCDEPWPSERIALFKRWMQDGMAP
jgi:hypothetical protein